MPQRRVEPNGAEGSDLTSLFYTPLSMNCGIGRAILQMVPQPSVELKQLDSQLKRDLSLEERLMYERPTETIKSLGEIERGLDTPNGRILCRTHPRGGQAFLMLAGCGYVIFGSNGSPT